MQKMRVRNHQVVLNRSVGGDAGIAFFLIIMGVFMFLSVALVVGLVALIMKRDKIEY